MVSPLSICREWTNITTPPKGLWRKLGMYTSTLHCELLGKRNQCPWNRFRNRIKHISYISRITGKGLRINYTTFELYPLSPDITEKLNYPALIAPSSESIFALLHQCEWNQKIAISPLFTLYKRHADLTRTSLEGIYDVVYFDAFAPEKQPEMWDEKIFREIFSHLSPGGILSTYCAKGEIRRRLQSVGFTVERLPGPPNGKREILRASKR